MQITYFLVDLTLPEIPYYTYNNSESRRGTKDVLLPENKNVL